MLILIFVLFGTTYTAPPVPPDVTCKEALANVGKIKVGLTENRVLELLGKTRGTQDGVWGYNFWECSPPPKVGEQLIIVIELSFSDDKVSQINYATICATGRG
jgi:hypothetical protein